MGREVRIFTIRVELLSLQKSTLLCHSERSALARSEESKALDFDK